MKLLLDTHVLLWWMNDDRALSKDARTLIQSNDNVIYVSAATVWEIRIKQKLGKLRLPASFEEALRSEGFEDLPIRATHAHRVANLPDIHQDPFDRILLAQALEDQLVFVTHDKALAKYPAEVRLV